MKKFASFIVTVFLVVFSGVCMQTVLLAAEVESEGLKYQEYDTYCVVTGPSAYSTYTGTDLIIPSTYNGKPVTGIGESAFKDRKRFTGNLVIPDSVTSIGDYAFSGCYVFTGTLTIGNSVTSIGNYAFCGCKGFTGSLVIPDSVTSIGNDAFFRCSDFTGSLTIGNNVESIGYEAFSDCSNLTEIVCQSPNFTAHVGILYTSDMTEIVFCLSGKSGSLTIPDTVKTIRSFAFYQCTNLTGNLVIPDSVESIEGMAFYGCSGFTGRLIIGNNVKSVESYAFYNCNFTGNLIIPDSVTSIGSYAFYWCSGFTGKLVIPDSVTNIGDGAFWGCSGFTEVHFLGNAPTVTTAYCNYASFPKTLTLYCIEGKNGWTTTGTWNGYKLNCEKEKKKSSGELAYAEYEDYCIVTGRGTYTGTDLIIPSTHNDKPVTGIADEVFRGCKGFTGSLVIPDSVTSIGNYAFYYCKDFTGDLIIPENVESIEYRAFQNCTGFTGVYFLGNAPKVTAAEYSSYASFPKNITLYYLEGTTGWTDSEAYDATAGTWNGYKLVVETIPAGITLSGVITSYNPQNTTTVTLVQDDEVKYSTVIAAEAGKGQVTQKFSINGIAAGTYDLVVTKGGHLTYTITDVVVSDTDIDLTASDKVYSVISLLAGDVNGDGKITSDDINIIWKQTNYQKDVADSEAGSLADVDGSGTITSDDINIIWKPTNYQKGIEDCTFSY